MNALRRHKLMLGWLAVLAMVLSVAVQMHVLHAHSSEAPVLASQPNRANMHQFAADFSRGQDHDEVPSNLDLDHISCCAKISTHCSLAFGTNDQSPQASYALFLLALLIPGDDQHHLSAHQRPPRRPPRTIS